MTDELASSTAAHLQRISRYVDLPLVLRILDRAKSSESASAAILSEASNVRGLSAWLQRRNFTVGQARPLLAIVAEAAAGAKPPQLVWTAFTSDEAEHQDVTSDVVADIIGSAQRELLIAGYCVSEQTLRRYGLDRISRSIEITVLADADRLELRDILDMRRLGIRVEPIRNDRIAPAKFHVKAIVSDAKRVLVTSANFTELGQHENIELGVVLEGEIAAEVAEALHRIIRFSRA